MKLFFLKTPTLIFILTFCFFNSSYSQSISSIDIPRLREGGIYLTKAIIYPKNKISLFDLKYTKTRYTHSYLVVFNYETKELKSTIYSKQMIYLFSSYIDNDSLLYLSKGLYFNRKIIYSLKTGEKIQSKMDFRCDKNDLSKEFGVIFESNDLYCTREIVYWLNYKMYFDEIKHSIIIENFSN